MKFLSPKSRIWLGTWHVPTSWARLAAVGVARYPRQRCGVGLPDTMLKDYSVGITWVLKHSTQSLLWTQYTMDTTDEENKWNRNQEELQAKATNWKRIWWPSKTNLYIIVSYLILHYVFFVHRRNCKKRSHKRNDPEDLLETTSPKTDCGEEHSDEEIIFERETAGQKKQVSNNTPELTQKSSPVISSPQATQQMHPEQIQ